MNDRPLSKRSADLLRQTEDGSSGSARRGKFRKKGVSPLVGDFVTISAGKRNRDRNSTPEKQLHPPGGRECRPSRAAGLVRDSADRAVPHRPGAGDRGAAGRRAAHLREQERSRAGEGLAGIYRRAGFRVVVTSAETGEDRRAARGHFRQALGVHGNSGVGKSSILNALCPELKLPVGEVSEKLGRGRHTTKATSSSTASETARLSPTRPAFPRSIPSGWTWF